jgi:hypothetical protein
MTPRLRVHNSWKSISACARVLTKMSALAGRQKHGINIGNSMPRRVAGPGNPCGRIENLAVRSRTDQSLDKLPRGSRRLVLGSAVRAVP